MDWCASLVITVIRDYGGVLGVLYLVDGSHSYLCTVAAFLWRHGASITTSFCSAPVVQWLFWADN